MANVTLAIDDDVLRRARIRALEQGTSVNALIREYLESFAGEAPANDGVAAFLGLAGRTSASSGKVGRAWTRDDAHAR
jgi:plasmid stability protein